MNPFYIFKLALTNIFSNKLRSLLTVSGIGVCVAITVFMVGLNTGLKNAIDSELEKPEFSNLITATPKVSDVTLDEAIVSRVKSMNNVSKVEYVANLSGKINYHGSSVSAPIYAVSENYFSLVPISLISGKNFDSNWGEKQVILNLKIVDTLGAGSADEIVGKKIILDIMATNNLAPDQKETIKNYSGVEYQVIGIISKGDSPLIYVPASNVADLGVKNFSQAKILATDYDKVSLTKESIEQLGFSVSTSKDTTGQFNKIFSLFSFILAVFVVLTLLVSTFGTINTISISLVEQTREIGFLRLIGIREKDVKLLFIFEAVFLVFLGSVIGIAFSYLLVFLGNQWISFIANAANLTIDNLIEVPYLVIVVVLIVSLIIGWLTGIKPAKRAVKIDPLTALRF